MEDRADGSAQGGRSYGEEWEEGMRQLFVSDDVVEGHKQCVRLYESVTPRRFWSRYWQHFRQSLATYDVELVVAIFSFWFDRAYDLFAPGDRAGGAAAQPAGRSKVEEALQGGDSARRRGVGGSGNAGQFTNSATGYLPQEFLLGLGGVLEEAREVRGVREIGLLLAGQQYSWYPVVAPYFRW